MGPEKHTAENGTGHLIDDEWLIAYAAGNLSEAKSALVATHASFHPVLRQKIHSAEAIGGALMEASDEASLSDGLYDKLLAKLNDTDCIDSRGVDAGGICTRDNAPEPTATSHQSEKTIFPRPLANYLNQRPDELKWRFMGPGMSQVKLHSEDNGEKLWLLRAKSGTEIPSHGHNGHEFTLVLQGSYSVEGQLFGVGDLELAADDIDDHRPIISEGADCICLVVTEAPINLKSLIGRAFQPFIGL